VVVGAAPPVAGFLAGGAGAATTGSAAVGDAISVAGASMAAAGAAVASGAIFVRAAANISAVLILPGGLPAAADGAAVFSAGGFATGAAPAAPAFARAAAIMSAVLILPVFGAEGSTAVAATSAFGLGGTPGLDGGASLVAEPATGAVLAGFSSFFSGLGSGLSMNLRKSSSMSYRSPS
jgi:hypothetical protein